jgi:hypothetical protein
MKTQKGLNYFKLAFVYLLIALNSGCILGVFIPAPKHASTPTDLLIGLPVVPSGKP